MASSALAQHLFGVEQRRAQRDEVFFRTRFRIIGGAVLEFEVVNLSRFGFMARTDADVPQEMRGYLRLPRVEERETRIVWSLGGRVGGEFRHPIEQASYFTLLSTVPREG